MKNVLIVDDSMTIRKTTEYAIKNLNCNILFAENGKDALEKINEMKNNNEELDICITDINMPEMGGIEFIKEFRKIDKFTPILVLTTETEQKTIDKGKVAGASGWIVKPFKPEELCKVIQKFI